VSIVSNEIVISTMQLTLLKNKIKTINTSCKSGEFLQVKFDCTEK